MADIKKVQELILKMDKIPAILPDTLKEIIGDSNRIAFQGKNLKTDYLIDIISTMLKKYVITNENYYNLSSEVLKRKYNDGYKYYIRYLEHHKILELFSDYYNGKKCRTYTIPRETLISEFNRTYITDKFLVAKYRELYSIERLKKENYKYISDKVALHVIDQLNRIKLSYNKAKAYLNSIEDQLTKEQYHRNLISLDNLKSSFTYISFDNYGRCHTNFTTLKSEIRDNFLLIDGEESRTMDISNSQPLFLSSLLSKNQQYLDPSEYILFKQLVFEGNLYEYVHNNRLINGINGDPFNSISTIKNSMYVVLFGKNRISEYNKYTSDQNKLFVQLFPTIFDFIRKYKSHNSDKHKALAYELQRSESNFLYNNICEEIIETYPDIPFFTVHDSITVKKSDYSKTKKIFDKHISRLHSKIK